MHLEPAMTQGAEHAHGLNGFSVMQVTGGHLAGLLGENRRVSQRLFGHGLIEARQPDQHYRARCGKHAEPDVEQIDHEQVHREPGGIEEGEQRRAGHELANVSQIPQRLPGVAFAPEQIALESGLINPQVEAALQLAADTNDDKTANNLQQANKRKEPHDHQRQHGQRGFILR
ncbi:hypothetical protein D3C84_689920 [compost metagenome]